MAHVICQPCVGTKDRSCVEACPVDCIHEGDDHLFIDPQSCVDCGACIEVCPVSAIYEEEAVPSEWRDFVQENARLADDADEPAA